MRSTTTSVPPPAVPAERDWSQIEERLEARGLRHGDRVVAVATVAPTSITIFGYGVYQHGTATDADVADLGRLADAIRAADDVGADHGPLVVGTCRHLPSAQAEAQRARFHGLEARRRAQPVEHRARHLLERLHHRRRVRLDSGDLIDADRCFVMRADTFHRYSAGTIVTKATPTA